MEGNISYGPWHNGMHFKLMVEGALEISVHMGPDDPILLRLWPRICKDFGWSQPHEVDQETRFLYLKGSAETSLAVLRQWWQWHESDTGEKCPLPAELTAA